MIISGADLIRNSGRQQVRAERIAERPTSAVQAPDAKSKLDDDTGGALLRFARFIHDEKEKKKKPVPKRNTATAYQSAFKALSEAESKGHTLDISV